MESFQNSQSAYSTAPSRFRTEEHEEGIDLEEHNLNFDKDSYYSTNLITPGPKTLAEVHVLQVTDKDIDEKETEFLKA